MFNGITTLFSQLHQTLLTSWQVSHFWQVTFKVISTNQVRYFNENQLVT